jgi:hypothetical protein
LFTPYGEYIVYTSEKDVKILSQQTMKEISSMKCSESAVIDMDWNNLLPNENELITLGADCTVMTKVIPKEFTADEPKFKH